MKTLKWLVLSTNKQGFGPCPKEVVMRPAKTFKELLAEIKYENILGWTFHYVIGVIYATFYVVMVISE